MYKIVEKTKIWFALSLIIIFIGIGFMATKGLEESIEFKGGTHIIIDMGKSFNKAEAEEIVKKHAPDETSNVLKDKTTVSFEIKSRKLDSATTNTIFKELKEKYKLKDDALKTQETMGASLGSDIKKNAIKAVIIANILILLYIGFRFEFKFGLSAIVALVHDVLITLSVYAIFRIPLDSAFIAAILTVLGYSMSDTIVVFDRIRENEKFMKNSDVTELANASITQTLRRSIFTVLTVVITLTCVFIFVPDIRNFSKPLLIGIISGCYSSIFIATPFWVILQKKFGNKKKKKTVAKKA